MSAVLEWLLSVDKSLMLAVQNIRLPWLNPIMRFFSFIGNGGIFWIALCLGLILIKKYRKAAIVSLIALLVCFLINNIALKLLVDRVRPYETIAQLKVLIPLPSDASFPSGHACSSFAVANALFLNRKGKWEWCLYILAGMISVSRIYVGVHYVTDILGGIFIGLFFSSLTVWLLKHKIKWFADA